jgi:hypothetical protein
LHYRAAALLSASPQLAESLRAAKRFRVVPLPEQSHTLIKASNCCNALSAELSQAIEIVVAVIAAQSE